MRRATALSTLMLSAMTMTSSAVDDAPRGPGGPNPERALRVLIEEVGLSEPQREVVRKILEERAAAIEALRERTRAGASREALRGEMSEVIESSSARIEAVLDEDQVAAYRKLRQERQAERRRQPRGSQRR